MADYKKDSKTKKTVVTDLYTISSNVFVNAISDPIAETRAVVNRILQGLPTDSHTNNLVNLSTILVVKSALNKATFKNINATYAAGSRYQRSVAFSPLNGPRYISILAVNLRSLGAYTLPSASYPGDTLTTVNTGLIIQGTKSPHSPSAAWDELISLTDVTTYGPSFLNDSDLSVSSSAVVQSGSTAEHIFLVYDKDAFTPSAGNYDFPGNSGVLPMQIQATFQSGHIETFSIKAPVGTKYGFGGPESMVWAAVSAAHGGEQRVNGCGTTPNNFYSQGNDNTHAHFEIQNSFGILTQWTPVISPNALLDDVSVYSPLVNTTFFGQLGGTPMRMQTLGNLHNDFIHFESALTSKATIAGISAKEEIHRIDTMLQNGTSYTPLIAGQAEPWYVTNFTASSVEPRYYSVGNTLSSLTNTVSILSSQSQNQIFNYTVYYGENLYACVSPVHTYIVCSDTGDPANYATTGLDCAGNTIPPSHLPGGSVFLTGVVSYTVGSCCTPCTLNLGVTSTDATYGNTDGLVSWSTRVSNLATGIPFSSGSSYTVTVTAASGASLTGTAAPSGGNSVTLATTVNDTGGSANRFTLSSNAQVVTGMLITSAHNFYTASSGGTVVTAYVGGIYAGNLNQNATEFYLVDINGIPVYSQSDATPNITFSTFSTGLFGALAPNTVANPFYEICVTDSLSCEVCLIFTIQEAAAPIGCTDSTAVNYDSTAVVDDGSCMLCSSSTGLLTDPLDPSNTLDLFDTCTIIPTSATWNSGFGLSTTHNSDGVLNITASVAAAAAFYMTWDSDSKFQIKTYKLVNPGDTSTSPGVSLVSTVNTSTLDLVSNATATVTGLAYGYYAVRVTYIDVTQASTLENCFSEFYQNVQAKVCSDTSNVNYMSLPVPLALRDPDSTLCAVIPCCAITGPYLHHYPGNSLPGSNPNGCNYDLVIDVACDATPRTLSPLVVSFSPINSGFMPISNMYSSSSVTVSGLFSISLLTPTNTNLWVDIYGTGFYKVSLTLIDSTGNICVVENTEFLQAPDSGCTDASAYNYNPAAVCDDGSCIFDSFDCDGLGNCFDPLNGLGQYGTLAACNASCFPPTILGCTDVCAYNYDPAANTDDGTCTYKACLDPTATNQYWSCDCNTLKVNATINDQACCVSPCINTETISAITGNATTNCTTFNSDGEVSITFSNTNTATNWTLTIYNALKTTIIYSDPTVYTGISTTSSTYSGLSSGVYTAEVINSFGCIYTEQFNVNSSASVSGCTDPNASNYNASATCDDGTCFICGCPDPNANNYNPNSSSVCPCEYDVELVSPCLPANVDTIIEKTQACLTLKGSNWLFDYKLGRTSDCPMLDKWKLILIEYLLTQDKEGIDCLYNCSGSTQLSINTAASCTDKWTTGGPSTGVNHAKNHLGATITSGEGTTVTTYDGYPLGWFGYDSSNTPQFSNQTYVGDVVKFDLPVFHPLASQLNGTIWELTTVPANITGLHEGCSLQKISHYTKCGSYKKIDIATNPINYYQKFVNFVNKFCKDCNISIITKI
tara:strand:- start:4477 stop:9042 length:4566 start_codon:yes stop_codon:yes gene_type:complete